MRRTLWLASFACLGGLALLAALVINTWSSADPGREDKPVVAASRTAPQLPIRPRRDGHLWCYVWKIVATVPLRG